MLRDIELAAVTEVVERAELEGGKTSVGVRSTKCWCSGAQYIKRLFGF